MCFAQWLLPLMAVMSWVAVMVIECLTICHLTKYSLQLIVCLLGLGVIIFAWSIVLLFVGSVSGVCFDSSGVTVIMMRSIYHEKSFPFVHAQVDSFDTWVIRALSQGTCHLLTLHLTLLIPFLQKDANQRIPSQQSAVRAGFYPRWGDTSLSSSHQWYQKGQWTPNALSCRLSLILGWSCVSCYAKILLFF